MTTALIGNISRNCMADGPGIRTTIFFKGCPLSCIWCHNPELQGSKPELSFDRQLCIGCGDCACCCQSQAIIVENTCRINSALCDHCMTCVENCPAQALKKVGTEYRLEELLELVLRDNHFYEVSGGGVTLSGGEPTMQLNFVLQFIKLLQKNKIHTAIESCGFFAWNEKLEELFLNLDLIYFDLKIANGQMHKNLTGRSNEGILENLRQLARLHSRKIIVTIPLIPQCTAFTKNLIDIALFLKSIDIMKVRLLPYHPYGQQSLNPVVKSPRTAVLPDQPMLSKELQKWRELFADYNFTLSD